jgi:hypothetical protein
MIEKNNNVRSMKYIIKRLYSFLIGIITIISVIIAVIQYFSEDIIELEVKAINKTQLTKIANIDGLTVEFLYKDSVVKNLWQIIYLIKNVGSKTIVAKGDSKNILEENLSISFNDSVKVLFADTAYGNFPITIIGFENNVANLDFQQWQKSEYTYIVAIVENFGETEPYIIINRRDIVDAKVTFLEQPTEIKRKKKLIEYFGHSILMDILKLEAIILIIIPYAAFAFTEIRDFRRKPNNTSIRDKINIIFWVSSTIIAAFLPLLWFF